MNKMSEPLTFTVPLSFEAHAIARQFQQQQTSVQKAKQVYLKALAVNAVDIYLRCLGFETDLEEGDRVNSVHLKFMEVADLWVKSIGRLECVPVLPEATTLQVPPEAQFDRVGFVAVQLEQSLKQATVLGFVPTATSELAIDQLRSLADFPEYLNALQQSVKPAQLLVHLGQWLENRFETGWQEIEALLRPGELMPAYRTKESAQFFAQRGKVIRLAAQVTQHTVILIVKLNPQVDNSIKILVEVHPVSGEHYLPEALQVSILEQDGTNVMKAIAGCSNQNLQFDFDAEAGECFSVQLTLRDISAVEEFVV